MINRLSPLVRCLPAAIAVAFGPIKADAQIVVSRTFWLSGTGQIPDDGTVRTEGINWDQPGATISNVEVFLDIREQGDGDGRIGDLVVDLTLDVDAGLAGVDARAVLMNRVGQQTAGDGGYDDEFGLTVYFKDTAPDIHNYRDTLFSDHSTRLGTYLGDWDYGIPDEWAPDGRTADPAQVTAADTRAALLSSFNNQAVHGLWELNLSDHAVGGLHELYGWGLDVTMDVDPGQTVKLRDDDYLFPTSAGQVLANDLEVISATAPSFIMNEDTLELAGSLTGSGELRKEGGGDLILTAPGTFQGAIAVFDGGLVANNSSGSATGDADVAVVFNGVLSGNGSLGGWVAVGFGGTISPGGSPGALTLSELLLADGGTYLWEINDALGTAGADPGWDKLVITGDLILDAGLDGVLLQLYSLGLDNSPGTAENFNPSQNYTWTIATVGGDFVDWDASSIDIDTYDFQNAFDGTFSLAIDGQDLNLHYSPVPEPAVTAAFAAGALAVFGALRRRSAGARGC